MIHTLAGEVLLIPKKKKTKIEHHEEIKYKHLLDELLDRPIPLIPLIPLLTKSPNPTKISVPTKYIDISTINYNVTHLKYLCKHHKLKVTGTKESLKKRLYNHLFYSHFTIHIQKTVRRLIVDRYIKLHGYKRALCVNDVDFCTLDSVSEIPYTQFISYKDEQGFIYGGFDILSLYNLYMQNKLSLIDIENPFTKKIIGLELFHNMMLFIKYSRLLKIPININYSILEILDETKRLDMKVLTLFQQMDSLGNYTNCAWFNQLERTGLVRFFRELYDIWNYRANLSPEFKRNICPPFGDPFRVITISYNLVHSYSQSVVRKNIIDVMEELITRGIDNDAKSLGSYYVLSALTLVSEEAAEALPWLYESVN